MTFAFFNKGCFTLTIYMPEIAFGSRDITVFQNLSFLLDWLFFLNTFSNYISIVITKGSKIIKYA